MSVFKIMTFNIQAQAFPAGPNDEAEIRATAVVEALHGLNSDDSPDVVVFNEADNEDAKAILKSGLAGIYPNFILSFGGFPAAFDDSGLAIFSKFEFNNLPVSQFNVENNKAMFLPFKDTTDDDALAQKGVGIVQVLTNNTFEIITIAFTHMQAFYQKVGEYSSVRFKQLKTIENGLNILLGNPLDINYNKVIVLGDMNIRGDLNPNTRGEWRNVFKIKPSIFSSTLVDAWRTYMKPPSALFEKDPGLTNYNLKAGKNLPAGLEERLDYMCTPNPNFQNQESGSYILPQYMRLLPTNISKLHQKFRLVNSDHKALVADYHWNFPHNSPTTAIMQSDFLVFKNPDPNSLTKINVTRAPNFPIDGVYQWIYMSEPGTYTFIMNPNIETTYFFEDNLSTEIKPFEKVSIFDLGLDNEFIGNISHEFGLSEKGHTVDVYKPMFIRLRGGRSNPNFVGQVDVAFIKHTGETWQTAFKIRAWDLPKNPNLPLAQPNGKNDECWFVATMDGKLITGDVYNSRFFVQKNINSDAKITLFDNQPPTNIVEQAEGMGRELSINFSTSVQNKVYLKLQRASILDNKFKAGWQSEISYLSNTYLRLFCIDETSGLGSDEINISLSADSSPVPFLNTLIKNFDDNELKGLETSLNNLKVGFKTNINVSIIEVDDGHDNDGPFIIDLPALKITDPMELPKLSKDIVVDDGKYRIEYGLSRN